LLKFSWEFPFQSVQLNTVGQLRTDQLSGLKDISRSLKEKEASLAQQVADLDEKSARLDQQIDMSSAAKASVQDLLENDFDMSRIQQTLQAYQFNIRTLTGEISRLQKKVWTRSRHDVLSRPI
jgi:chromosome segregation ATPase